MSTPRASKSAAAPAGRSGFVRGVWERIKAHKVVQWTLAYLGRAATPIGSDRKPASA
jgi:hypothetical protein